jgi:hypothetical protein
LKACAGTGGVLPVIGFDAAGTVWTVINTALNPEFTVNEAGKLEISVVASEALKKEISEEDSAYISAVDKTLVRSAMDRCSD